MRYQRPELFREPSEEEKRRGRRTFLLLVSSSVVLSLALTGLLFFVSNITYDLEVQIDHSVAPYKTQQKTVAAALKEAGFTVGELDIVEPGLNARLSDDMLIRVKRVKVVTEKEEEQTDFKTVEEEDASMKKGETKTTREGKQGTDLVTYQVTYTAGEETARKETGRKTIKKPVDKVVHVGIVETIDGFAYTRKEVFEASAYTGGGRTASGTRARVGEIAVDPRVIPLGTTVYVEGFGLRTAEDTGGAIKGNIIDIYMASTAECRRWGRRNVTVYLP